jgi:16S rRNA (uracil1498-N3)-methyltransferase
MALPYFFLHEPVTGDSIHLDEANSRHVVSVLRMEPGELMHLTDGKGSLLTARTLDAHKKKCLVSIIERQFLERGKANVSIGISLLKNVSRMEWFLEKATEIGVTGILPMICQRTEKQHFRFERMQQILISAMLQSEQVWLPVLEEPTAFDILVSSAQQSHKWIAHCLETERRSLRAEGPATGEQLLMIGPEGDFTPSEIELAINRGFVPVVLGETRLRTETAGMVGASLLCIR